MHIKGSTVSGIDERLWAYLRILYAQSEDDLVGHGYTPSSVGRIGSMLAVARERSVIRTLIGILGIALSAYETDVRTDVLQLRASFVDKECSDVDSGPDGLLLRARKLLRGALSISPPMPSSPTLHRMGPMAVQEAEEAAQEEEMERRIAAARHELMASRMVASSEDDENDGDEDMGMDMGEEREWSTSTGGSLEADISAGSSSSSRRGRGISPSRGRRSSLIYCAGDHAEQAVLDDVRLNRRERFRAERTCDEDDDESACDGTGGAGHDMHVSLMGFDLPISQREALRFRVRKKRTILALVRSLGEVYMQLNGGSMDGLISEEEFKDARSVRRARVRAYLGSTHDPEGSDRSGGALDTARSVSETWGQMDGMNL